MSNRNMPDIYRDECGGNSKYAPDNNPRDDEEDWVVGYFQELDIYIYGTKIKNDSDRVIFKGKTYEDCVEQLHKWYEEAKV